MAYNQHTLDIYRALCTTPPSSSTPAAAPGEEEAGASTARHGSGTSPAYTPSVFRSRTCPYCNGLKDPTVKHIHPDTKPSTPWSFWQRVLVDKYRNSQSVAARVNMAREVPTPASAASCTAPEAGTTSDKMFVVGPMVDQSELPFRLLCRQYGATLTYTPMLHAKLFRDGLSYRRHYLTTTPCEAVRAALANATAPADAESSATSTPHLIDRPVIVQFCGNDAEVVLEAARLALYEEDENMEQKVASTKEATGSGTAHAPLYRCDAVDLNLGCPQGIAKRGHYGSFLMEDWEAIHTIIHTLHVELEVPVTAKIRVFDAPASATSTGAARPHTQTSKNEVDPETVCYDEALTIEYARMVRDAGAQVICVHGRTRAMKGQQSGLANMELIGRVREALEGSVPVLSNGNVLAFDDVMTHLARTQCEGHMCAEPLLWEPRVFTDVSDRVRNGRLFGADKAARLAALDTAMTYLTWVRRCPVDLGFVKTHLFKMCHHSYELHSGFRDVLGRWGTAMGDAETVDSSDGLCANEATANTGTPAEAAASAGAPLDFEAQVAALESHLRALRAAEIACDVEGEQPKSAQAEKQKAREAIKDVFEEDDGEVGFGLLF